MSRPPDNQGNTGWFPLFLVESFRQAVIDFHKRIGNCLAERVSCGADIVVISISRGTRKLKALIRDQLLCDLYRPETEVPAIADFNCLVHISAPSIAASI